MRGATAREVVAFGSGHFRIGIALMCSTILLCGTPDKRGSRAQVIRPTEIAARIGKRLGTSKNIEVRLRSGNVISAAGVIVKADSLELFADMAKKQSVRIVDVRSIDELQFTTRSRAGRALGGVLGGLGGLVLGGLLAFTLGSADHNGAALVALVAAPVAGALAGANLPGRESWERVVVRE